MVFKSSRLVLFLEVFYTINFMNPKKNYILAEDSIKITQNIAYAASKVR
jgi:hypothetical protein